MHVRVCVDCGEEYRPEVARCADCGGELEDRHDDGGTFESTTTSRIAASADEPLPGARPLALASDARDLVPLADALLRAGLAFRIAARELPGDERPRGFELRVQDPDRRAALRVVVPLMESGGGVTLLELVASDTADPVEDAGDEPSCPACEARLPASAKECPECGLGLAGEDAP